MDYSKLKVNDLRALCKERGIPCPNDTHKADLVALLSEADSSPEEVQAEVVNEPSQSMMMVSFSAGTINANFDVMETRLDDILAPYKGYSPDIYDAEQMAQCRRDRLYVRNLGKEFDAACKSVENGYEAPLKEFRDRKKIILAKIKAVGDGIYSFEQEREQARRDRMYSILQEHYEGYAGLLVDVIPYERIHQKEWLNKTFNEMKAKAEIEQKVERIAHDWETLKSLGLPNQDQAEIHFFANLDLGAAVAYAKKLADDAARIEAMKADMREYEPQDPMTMEPEHVPVVPQPEPAPMPPAPTTPPSAPPSPVQGDIPKPRVMVIDAATLEQCRAIGRFCGSIGVTGTFKTGTLAEVAARSDAM